MNAGRFDYIMQIDPYTRELWRGIYSLDEPIPINPNPKGDIYLLNTAPSDDPGEHWCLLFRNNDVCELFDSYGHPPSFYKLHIPTYKNLIVYNPFQLQGPFSRTCGHHCLFFALHRARGFSFLQILTQLYFPQSPYAVNDNMVVNFIFTRFGTSLAKID